MRSSNSYVKRLGYFLLLKYTNILVIISSKFDIIKISTKSLLFSWKDSFIIKGNLSLFLKAIFAKK